MIIWTILCVINFVVYFFTLISYFYFIYTKYQSIKKGSADIFQYKIKSLLFSWFISIVYVSFFIIFLYLLRVWRHGKSLDLKKKLFYPFMDLYCLLDFILFSYFLLIFVAICFLISLIFLKIHSFCVRHITKLNLYHNITLRFPHYPNREEYFKYKQSFFYRLNSFLDSVADRDIISFTISEIPSIISHRIDKKRGNIYGTPNFNLENLHTFHKYNPLSYFIYLTFPSFQNFITISPFILFIYECIAYDFVISWTFTYLLVYIPLMLLRRITKARSFTSEYICYILYNIFYKKEQNCIYAIPEEAKNLWEYVIRNNLCGLGPRESMKLTNDPCFEQTFDFQLFCHCYFIPFNDEPNTFMNNEICCRVVENKLLREKEEEVYDDEGTFIKIETILLETWSIIAKK